MKNSRPRWNDGRVRRSERRGPLKHDGDNEGQGGGSDSASQKYNMAFPKDYKGTHWRGNPDPNYRPKQEKSWLETLGDLLKTDTCQILIIATLLVILVILWLSYRN